MKIFLLFFCFLYVSITFGQIEQLNVITSRKHSAEKLITKGITKTTFDSTFLYISDTLSLPILDDFSSDKFQKYNADFLDPNLTSVKEYKLIDPINLLPLANSLKYTTQPTFKRSFNLASNTYKDTVFNPTIVKIGDQTKYPSVYSSTNVYPPYYIYDTLDYPNPVDTIWLTDVDVYQDSAIQLFLPLKDKNAIWLDDNVYRNYRLAKNPWSIGVATFDGLNRDGKAYMLGSTSVNYADYLTSKPIDLSNYTKSDSVYLSFLYQKEGYGDIPEDSDSLVLEYFADDTNEWDRVWSTNGGPVHDFKVVLVKLKDSKYYKKGFQFRFKNYGRLAGGFDNFHIDYVHLSAKSNVQDTFYLQDTLVKDFAFVYPISTLLKDYISVPWDHYKNNPLGKMSDNVSLTIRNGSNQQENNSPQGKVEIFHQNNLETSFTVSGASLSNNNLNYSPRTIYSSFHDFSNAYRFDESKIGNKQYFDIKGTIQAIFPNFHQNDTTVTTQVFENYYSYDDGTSEVAYSPTGAQTKVAVRFDAYQVDSLIGIMTQFVESSTDVSKSLFYFSVWDDNNGKPGNLIYEDDSFSPRNPKYSDNIGGFITYYFKDTMKVGVPKTFYIGWRQVSSNGLNLGYDLSRNNASKVFYSVNNTNNWMQSGFSGTVLIRPVYSTSMDVELGISKIINKDFDFTIYPNPSSGVYHLKSNNPEFKGIEVYSIQGVKVKEELELILDISNLPSGVYFVKEIGNNSLTQKIIKN